MSAPLIHIGYHKTGTTWLQEHLFANATLGFEMPFVKRHLAESIAETDSLDFDAEACRRRFTPGLEAVQTRGLTPVLSAERLSGNPHSGGYDSHAIMQRLALLFPQARVLICLREQQSILLSAWQQYVKIGGIAGLTEYLQPPGGRVGRYPRFSLDFYRYDRLIRAYQQTFGADRVLVLPLERFIRQPREFVAAICSFTGARDDGFPDLPYGERSNEALSPCAVEWLRRANRISGPNDLNPHPLVWSTGLHGLLRKSARQLQKLTPGAWDRSLKSHYQRRITTLVGEYYAESNQKTAAMTGLDLGALGYKL